MAQKIKSDRSSVVMVGPFPPPTHGMASVNLAICLFFRQNDIVPVILDLSAPSLARSFLTRLRRLPRVLNRLLYFVRLREASRITLYLSVSGGFGQLYDIIFVLLARLRGMHVILHHHSFAYLDNSTRLMRMLASSGGNKTLHVVQSQNMAKRLQAVYGVSGTLPISNAIFFVSKNFGEAGPSRNRLVTLGFLSNITSEKGIYEFLDLLAAVRDAGIDLSAKIAGPFGDDATEKKVFRRLARLPNIEYVGPKYGMEKDAFYASIDAFVFPTRYQHETEGIVNHEAMSHGLPVIAYGRGCIPEFIGADCGLVIDPAKPFVPPALGQIQAWLARPAVFAAASNAARRRFEQTYSASVRNWDCLLAEIAGEYAG